MSNDTGNSDKTDGEMPSVQDMFQTFADVASEQDALDDETAESFKRLFDNEATDEDQEQLMDAMDSWLNSRFGDE